MTEDTTVTSNIKCIRTARVIDAAPAELWRAWTDPSSIKSWWGKTAKATNVSCDFDPRVGGRLQYRFQLPGHDAESSLIGEITEISPPVRLLFTILSSNSQDQLEGTRVTVEFMDLKDGTSRAVITHEEVSQPQRRTESFTAWSNALQDLAVAFAK